MAPKPKSPGRIEVWRHEVSNSFTPSETEYLAPPIAQPSFWKKILRRDSKSSRSEGAAAKLQDHSEGKESVKTEMYDPEEKQVDEGLVVPDQGEDIGRESSMDMASADSELGGLRERRERLERAAKLLNGSGRGKERGEGKKAGE
jgi:hypothetical protein